ncbi:RNA polymerase II-associated protein 1 [Anopheles cruzii]|uniref:RNA polymerase II-associated protein 1 n=1 Tax=Anopheles cruzii TaxID=68878 RepID=UPI0022EC68EC|nr:RNA polymerase II-associated protein 1 [Anopheles cruzii]
MIKRPSKKDSENEILRMQQEFYAEQNRDVNFQPAAKVVRMQRDGNTSEQPSGAVRQSVFAKGRAQRHAELTVPPVHVDDEETKKGTIPKPEDSSPESFVMGEIVEREPVESFQVKEAKIDGSFPKTMHISTYPASSSADRPKKSLFAQMLKKEGSDPDVTAGGSIRYETAHGSTLLEGWDAREIHNENKQKLQKMSEEEIRRERDLLLSTLDPQLVNFLKSRKKQTTISEPSSAVACSGVEEKPPANLDSLAAGMEVLKEEGSDQWINFDVLETEKLEWTKDVERSVKQLKPGESYEARFNWKGILQPYVVEPAAVGATDDRELYLHGDDAQRPGYTLQELFRLARSNVLQQRISAIGAIAGLLNILNQGFYDGVLELPVSKVFFFLRFALDENTPSVVEVASRALASLFYNETDEILLDTIYDSEYGMIQPELALNITHSSEEDRQRKQAELSNDFSAMRLGDSANDRIQRGGRFKAYLPDDDPDDVHNRETMNDFHLAETDLVECLIRTNILERIRYILFTMQPEGATVINCVKLLIRVARTSEVMALKIATNEPLIGGLVKQYLTSLDGSDHQPQAVILKLMRLLCSYRGQPYERYLRRFHVVNLVKRYIFSRKDIDIKMIQIQIESFRFLRLLQQGNPDDELYSELWPALCYLLEWHYQHLIFDESGAFVIRQHGVSLLALIGSGLQREAFSTTGTNLDIVRARHQQLCEKLFHCFSKWFTVALRSGANEFSQKLLLAGCLWTAAKARRLAGATAYCEFFERFLLPFVRSDRFEKITRTLSVDSLILVNRTNIVGVPALPTLGAVQLRKHQTVPSLIVTRTYPILFLHALLHLLSDQSDVESLPTAVTTEMRKHVLGNASHVQYLEQLAAIASRIPSKPSKTGADADGGHCNWFRQTIEQRYVLQLLQLMTREILEPSAVDHRRTIRGTLLRLAFTVTFTLSEAFYSELVHLFDGIIFASAFYCNEMEKLPPSLSNADLQRWKLSYKLVAQRAMKNAVSFSFLNCGDGFTVAEWKSPLLARSWPYSPLYLLVERLEQGATVRPDHLNETTIIDTALRFSELAEANGIIVGSVTERLMYLMAAFLGPDSKFLQPDLSALIERRIVALRAAAQTVTAGRAFDFETAKMEGKKSYYGLYQLALDIFQSSSYGHAGFGSLLMAPLAQKYDVRWRNLVWSEYVAVLRFITCSSLELFDPLAEYLRPGETDIVLLRSYAQALTSNQLRPGSIPHLVANHHVEAFHCRFRINQVPPEDDNASS